jgi:hypothetical protein
MANLALRLLSPANEMQTVRPGRNPNARLRTRNYLTEAEVKRFPAIASASATRPCSWLFFGTGCVSQRPARCAGPITALITEGNCDRQNALTTQFRKTKILNPFG